MVLSKETLKNAYTAFNNSKLIKGDFTKGRYLGWMESNLIELGIMEIGAPIPYEEGETYEQLILRLVKETIK